MIIIQIIFYLTLYGLHNVLLKQSFINSNYGSELKILILRISTEKKAYYCVQIKLPFLYKHQFVITKIKMLAELYQQFPII